MEDHVKKFEQFVVENMTADNNITPSDFMVRGIPDFTTRKYKFEKSAFRFKEQLAMGKAFFCFSKDGLSLAKVEGPSSRMDTEIAYLMDPKIAEVMNQIGEKIKNRYALEIELFKSSLFEALKGDKKAFDAMGELYGRDKQDSQVQ